MHTSTHNADVSLAQEFKKHLYHASRKHDILDYRKQKCPSKQNFTKREYCVQNNKYSEHQYIKMYFTNNQFPELAFCGPHNKLHGAHGLGKSYYTSFYTKLLYVTCEISHITCAFTKCTFKLEKPWNPGVPPHQ